MPESLWGMQTSYYMRTSPQESPCPMPTAARPQGKERGEDCCQRIVKSCALGPAAPVPNTR